MNHSKVIKKLLLTLVFAIAAYFIQLHYPWGGLILCFLLFIMWFATDFSDFASLWNTRSEKPILFALFWGLMIGLVVPFAIEKYLL